MIRASGTEIADLGKYDVAIIGAGAAGLDAASTLCSAGLNVCVLEASARIGGRITILRRKFLSN